MRMMTWLAAAIAAGWLACAPATAQKISDLPAATSLGGTEQLRGIQGSGCLTHTTPCLDVRVSASQLATLAAASLNAKLVNIAALSPSADSCLYFTSSTAVASYSCTSFGRSLDGSADAAAARSTLGLVIGTNVQAFNANLGTISGLSPANDDVLQRKSGAWTNRTVAQYRADLGTSWALCKSAVAVSITSTTTETTLTTCTIPANAIGPNGQVEIQTLWSSTNSANTKTFRIKFGGTAFYAFGGTTVTSLAAITRIANRNATNSQVGMASIVAGGTGQSNGTGVTTAAVDTTASVNIDFTAQLTNTGETVTLESYLVRVTYGA